MNTEAMNHVVLGCVIIDDSVQLHRSVLVGRNVRLRLLSHVESGIQVWGVVKVVRSFKVGKLVDD